MTIHLYYYDTACGTSDYGIPTKTLKSYFPSDGVVEDLREDRSFSIATTPYSTTSVSLLCTDVDTLFTSDTVTTDIFSILDDIFYMADVTTADSLESELESLTSVSYVENSLTIGDTISVSLTKFDTAMTIDMPQYVEFQLTIDDTATTISVWFDNDYMSSNYLDTDISVIIPPMDLTELYNTTTFSSSTTDISQATTTAAYFASAVSDAIANYDNTGVTTLAANYYAVDSDDVYISITFAILYRGHTPGTIALQTYVKDYLLASGVGDEDGWAERLPSLFVSSNFYLVPMWDTSSTSGSTTLYCAISNVADVTTKVTKTLYDMTDRIANYLEIMPSTYDAIPVAALSDENNDDDYVKLSEVLTTYQGVSSTDSVFSSMTAEEQTFSTYLGRCLAVASGESSDTLFSEVDIDDRTFLSFNVNSIAYYVLNKETYTNLIS